jgi:hypothetical protein
MSIADARIEMQLVIAQLLVQSGNEGLCFVSTDMAAAIAPHFPIAHSHQIAAKDDFTFVYRHAHATSLNGTPPTIIYLRVVAQDGHTGAGTAGFHAGWHGANQAYSACPG